MSLSETFKNFLLLALEALGLRVLFTDLHDLSLDDLVLYVAHVVPLLGSNLLHFLFGLDLLSLDQHAFLLQLAHLFIILLFLDLGKLLALFLNRYSLLVFEALHFLPVFDGDAGLDGHDGGVHGVQHLIALHSVAYIA